MSQELRSYDPWLLQNKVKRMFENEKINQAFRSTHRMLQAMRIQDRCQNDDKPIQRKKEVGIVLRIA